MSNSSSDRRCWVIDSQAKWDFYLPRRAEDGAGVPRRAASLDVAAVAAQVPYPPVEKCRGRFTYSPLGVCVLVKVAERVAEQVVDLRLGERRTLTPCRLTEASTMRGAPLERVHAVIARWWKATLATLRRA